MTKQPTDIKLFCRHGVKDGPAEFIERFKHSPDQGVWIPTVRGWSRTQQLQGDTAMDISTHDPHGGAIRMRYEVECGVCGRPLRRRMEKLSDQLYMAAHLGFDTLYLDDIT